MTKRKTKYRVVVYKDRRGEFRVKIVHRNGRIIVVTGEGYKRRGAALRSLSRLITLAFVGDQVEWTK